MDLVTSLLLLQAGSQPQDSWNFDEYHYHAGFGPDAEYWVPRFRGQARVDNTSGTGTSVDLTGDLNLPSHAKAIPIYGGGTIYLPVAISQHDKQEVLLTAEYWARGWMGVSVLSNPVVMGDQTFPAGSGVHSHLRLESVDLAIVGRWEDNRSMFRGGLSLALHVVEATL